MNYRIYQIPLNEENEIMCSSAKKLLRKKECIRLPEAYTTLFTKANAR